MTKHLEISLLSFKNIFIFMMVKHKEKKLLLMCVLQFVFALSAVVFCVLYGDIDYLWFAECTLVSILSVTLYVSYRKHTKNIMKPVLGAILILCLYFYMKWAIYYFTNINGLFDWFQSKIGVVIFLVIQVLLFITILLINIIHYAINSTHHSSPKKIKINRTLFIILIVLLLSNSGCIFIFGYETSFMFGMISDISSIFADICLFNMIISIESYLDEFRMEREEKIG